jgi:hypothetical protein
MAMVTDFIYTLMTQYIQSRESVIISLRPKLGLISSQGVVNKYKLLTLGRSILSVRAVA